MKTGSWITLPADPTIVFQKDPGSIWPDMLRSLGKSYEMYVDMPVDPSLN
jgi:putative transcriptional regulator